MASTVKDAAAQAEIAEINAERARKIKEQEDKKNAKTEAKNELEVPKKVDRKPSMAAEAAEEATAVALAAAEAAAGNGENLVDADDEKQAEVT